MPDVYGAPISFPDPGATPPFSASPGPADDDGSTPPPPVGTPVRDRLIGAGVVLALVALLAGTVVWRVQRDDTISATAFVNPDEPASGGSTTSSVPDGQWPIEVQPLVSFVERARGAPFDHPVPIEFLDEQDYKDSITETTEDTTPEDQADTEAWEGQLRALGLIGKGSLDDATDQLTGEGTLAYYDTDDQVIRVLGTDLDVAHRVTLVHELTHAWQDQQGYLDDFDELDATDAFIMQTLVEGDAMRIEYQYVGELSSRDFDDYQDQSMEAAEGADLGGVPDSLLALFFAPYTLGQPLVDLLDQDGGNDTVDEALSDPPQAEVDLMVPGRWFDRVAPVEVATPTVPAGAEEIDSGTFGAVSWLITLGERVDPRDALDVVDRWAGDAYVTYRQDGRVCTAATYQGTGSDGTDAAVPQLEAWAAAMEGHDATVERVADGVTLRTCEDSGNHGLVGRAQTTMEYPAIRLEAMSEAVGAGATLDQAFCFGNTIVHQLTVDDVESGAVYDPDRIQQLGDAASQACLD